MNLSAIASEVEYELKWRREEIAQVENQLAGTKDEDSADTFRKMLVVVLYSHLEGFARVALTIYVRTVNRLGMKAEDVVDELAAASLSNLFERVESGAKHPFFKRPLPDDVRLHAHYRRTEFLSRVRDVLQQVVAIDEAIVETASNLRSIVLKKNMYQLGLGEDAIEELRHGLDQLVNLRNAIAHGDRRRGVSKGEYAHLQGVTFRLMEDLRALVVGAYAAQGYLRPEKRAGS